MTKKRTDNTMWFGAPLIIFSRAKKLRATMTLPEMLLWKELKGKKFHGLKFRRQHPMLVYVADFYCHQLKLVIEIDGGYHLKGIQRKLDNERTQNLKENGIRVIRFTNDEVINYMPQVLNKLGCFIKEEC